ncbi:PREDICTED: probable G-protein coupled receptor 21 [Corvus brachyrhynchos]|uniref:probable G-protein coupled receptor 21 n=1 Tax=Corvus brachyrhynchos TaxID=85066 RepID=UPI0008165BFF|nr:PREDICTED: probable G-protein coupled receptor 21 [Corvus brachyrhynchos]
MNSSLVGNQSGRPFCLLAISYLETINFCLLEVVIIVFLMVLIISGNIIVIFVFHCAPLQNHHTTTMAPRACISIDRYIAITKPLTYNTLVTPWRLRICILTIWVYSCLVFLPSFHWGKPGYHGDVFQWCASSWNTDPYFTLFIVVMLYAPAAFIVCFTYFNIFRICQQHTKEINERRVRFSSQDGEAGEAQPCPDKRYAMVLFRITSVFYILWLPYIIYFLLESSNVYSNRVASFLTTWLAISNSFCNCVIYSLSNSVFQKGLKRLSGAICASCARQRVAKDSSTSRSKRSSNGCHV